MHLLLLTAVLTTTPDVAAASCGTQGGAEPRAAAPVETPSVFLDVKALTKISAVRRDAVIGREVALRELRVDQVEGPGFWVTTESLGERLFVFPAEGELIEVEPGDVVNIQGDVRLRPEEWSRRHGTTAPAGQMLIYAYTVRPARVVGP